MKNIAFIILSFFSLDSFAQKESKIDTVYYLINNANAQVNSPTWKIEIDYPYKYFILACRCLSSNANPALSYNMKINGWIIRKKEMETLKSVNITTLILKAKKFLNNNFNGQYAIFLMEPLGKRYVVHKVVLYSTEKDPGLTDYENITAPDTAKKKKQ